MTTLERLLRVPSALGWVDEPNDVYHAAPGLSSSALKVLCQQTPAHFLHALGTTREPTPAMRWGSIAHAFILEGHTPLVMPPFKGKGSVAAKAEWLAANGSGNTVDEEELAALFEMKKSVSSNSYAARAIECGHIETSGYARSELLTFKIRPDIRMPHEHAIYDLKTCGSAAPDTFSKDAWNLGYHIQAAWYLAVANAIEPDVYHSFRWIAVEKNAPYPVAIYEASPDQIEAGTAAVERALNTLACCIEDGIFPAYPAEVVPLDVPRWEKKKMEQAI